MYSINTRKKIVFQQPAKDEFKRFLSQSNLRLSEEIANHVYHWTNGNPRMTWDICSEIENLLNVKCITKDDIDNIIKSIYLTTFDKPPIDNIREIVKKDVEIRNAIIEIEYKKGNAVSDKIKNKLYLSGIINHEDEGIQIKNRIMKQALNLEWIKSLEEEEKGLVRIASDLFEKENYSESLKTFEKFLQNNAFNDIEHSVSYYKMGVSAYQEQNFVRALEYLDQTKFDREDDSKLFYLTLNLKGSSYFYLGEIDKSIEFYKIVLGKKNKDETYVRALMNFGAMSTISDNPDYRIEAKNIFKEIINETGIDLSRISQDFLNEIKSIAHYNLATLHSEDEDKNLEIQNLKEAISIAKNETRPIMWLRLLSVTNNQGEKDKILADMVRLLNEDGISPANFNPETPMKFNFEQFKELLLELYLRKRDTLFQEVKQHLNLLGDSKYSRQLYILALFSVDKNRDWTIANEIFKDLIKNKKNPDYQVDNEIYYNTLRFYAYAPPLKDTRILIEFADLFQSYEEKEINHIDISIFANLISNLQQNKSYNKVLSYIKIINKHRSTISDEYRIEYLVIDYFELTVYYENGDKVNAVKMANKILQFVNDKQFALQKSSVLGETGLKNIKQYTEFILRSFTDRIKPVKSGKKKYGRNDYIKVKYSNGEIKEIKYKKVENDLKSGLCVILE